MNGAGMSRASQARDADDTTTMAVSHPQSGTRAASARSALPTEVDLGEPSRDLRGLGCAGRDADAGSGLADLAQDLVGDRRPAGDALERGGLTLGDALEVVL